MTNFLIKKGQVTLVKSLKIRWATKLKNLLNQESILFNKKCGSFSYGVVQKQHKMALAIWIIKIFQYFVNFVAALTRFLTYVEGHMIKIVK